jgi:hypothetical protein
MKTTELSARQVVEFVVKHLSNRSLQSLAEVTRINASNLRSALSGTANRALPIDQLRRLATAAGLRLQLGDSGEQVSLERDTVLHLEVGIDDLGEVAQVAQALTNQHPRWRVATAASRNGFFMTAITRLPFGDGRRGYLAAHVAHQLTPEEIQAAGKKLDPKLPPKPAQPGQPVQQVTDGKWIRLRSALQNTRDFDAMFRVGEDPSAPSTGEERAEPTADAWAAVLKEAHRLCFEPSELLELMNREIARSNPT